MPFTRGAREVPNQTPASTSDARKRQAEKAQRTIEVKVDVDTDELREWAGKHADAGQAGVAHVLYATARQLETGEVPAFLDGGAYTPPPVEPAPWERISTDRDQPTLAVVNGLAGRFFTEGTRYVQVYDDGKMVFSSPLRNDTHVELLHTYSPETHVLVERALIDEAARWLEWWDDDDSDPTLPVGVRGTGILRDLAALADGAQS